MYMFVGHPLGRRRSILIGDTFVIIGGSLQASSWSVPQIIIARVLCGFGVGFISCTVLTYMSEMSITKVERGIEAANQSIWLIGGVAFGMYLSKEERQEALTDKYGLQLTGLTLASLKWTTKSPGASQSPCSLSSPPYPSP